jgi:hypothetical protein
MSKVLYFDRMAYQLLVDSFKQIKSAMKSKSMKLLFEVSLLLYH